MNTNITLKFMKIIIGLWNSRSYRSLKVLKSIYLTILFINMVYIKDKFCQYFYVSQKTHNLIECFLTLFQISYATVNRLMCNRYLNTIIIKQ